MLQKLSIRNYALIDNLEIDFNAGLNIITGETGAGKSIILGALSLILGQRVETKYFFNQEKKCVIEGTFKLANQHLEEAFEQADVDFEPETTLRREIAIDGKSRAFINDTPVNLTTLKLIGEQLIAIHSQHATQEIANSNFQLLILDVLANHHPILTSYQADFKQLKSLEKQLQRLKAESEEAKSRQDYEQYLFNELEQAAIKEAEQEVLEADLERLTHAETIKRALVNANRLINEGETASTQILKEANIQLNGVEKFDNDIADINSRLKSTLIELKDIANELTAIEENTEYNGAKMQEIQDRLDLFYALQQKHKVTDNTELLEVFEKLSNNLSNISHQDEEIEKLAQQIHSLTKSLTEQAEELHQNRAKAVKVAQDHVSASLARMNMPSASILYEINKQSQLSATGFDEVKLLFTANAGQAHAPVGKVASGGELSRLMLAVKALIARYTSLPTLIFDEIDTGISGETALRVGEVIDDLAKDMQIMAITHLPQIAAKGNSHYFVYKAESESKTTTGIKKLAQEERVVAIAEMLSGKNPGASALQNANDLLNQS
jgi:DNA repair protein RecN (Recombination protein N)